MFKWIRRFIDSSAQTKFFVLTWAVFGITIVYTTVYCFARLDYVRSYKTPDKNQEREITGK